VSQLLSRTNWDPSSPLLGKDGHFLGNDGNFLGLLSYLGPLFPLWPARRRRADSSGLLEMPSRARLSTGWPRMASHELTSGFSQVDRHVRKDMAVAGDWRQAPRLGAFRGPNKGWARLSSLGWRLPRFPLLLADAYGARDHHRHRRHEDEEVESNRPVVDI